MSQATELLGVRPAPYVRIVAAVSAAHFVSHYYILLLAPLLPIVRAAYDVSYTEIGLTFAAFNVTSTILQTPVGFLVDRLGARILLIAGLVIGAGAFIIAGLVDSFWVLVAMFGLAGIGNTVYHPADYAMLSHHVPADRIGKAFSVHTCAGMLGSAVAPASVLLMQNMWGWRGAFIGAGFIGFAVAAWVAAVRENANATTVRAPRAEDDAATVGWDLLLSAPILLNLTFFGLLTLVSLGISNYSVVALGAQNGTPVTVANAALSANLFMAAVGVLVGGVVATRLPQHGLVTALGLAAIALLTALLASVDLGTLPLIAVMAACGFSFGVIMPSRDMIVRDITPPGSFGKVFGFVTTGFNVGGIIAPLIFGAAMDHGSPNLVFLLIAAFSLVSIVTVVTQPRRTA